MGNCLEYSNLTYDNIYRLYPKLTKSRCRLENMVNIVLKDNRLYENREYLKIEGDRQYKYMITMSYNPSTDMICVTDSKKHTFIKGLYICYCHESPDMLNWVDVDVKLKKHIDVMDALYKYGFIHLLDIYASIHDLNLENYLSTKV